MRHRSEHHYAPQPHTLLFFLQIPWVVRSLRRLTAATRSRSAACPYSPAWASQSAHCSSTPAPRAHKSSWTWPRGQSKDMPAFATPSPLATGPSHCMNRSGSRWEHVYSSRMLELNSFYLSPEWLVEYKWIRNREHVWFKHVAQRYSATSVSI